LKESNPLVREITKLYDEKSFNGEGYVFRYAFPVLIRKNSPDRTDFQPTSLDAYSDAGFCNEITEDEYIIQAKNARTHLTVQSPSCVPRKRRRARRKP